MSTHIPTAEYEKISLSQRLAADKLFQLLQVKPQDKVLDIGCATGYLTAQIKEVAPDTVGIDIAPEMIEQAQKFRPQITFKVADGEALREENCYDCIVTNAVTYYFKDLRKTIHKFYRALKPGGKYGLQAQTELSPQFLHAMAELEKSELTCPAFSRFKLNINQLNINQFLLLFIEVGFKITHAELISYQDHYTIEQAIKIFKAGTATPFLNPIDYGLKQLPASYVENFWKLIEGKITELAQDGKLELSIPRCFIIAKK